MGFEERIDVDSPWWGEHVSRYEFALQLVRGKVMDVACGTGYGVSILQKRADWVVGVDIDEDALARAAAVIDRSKGEVLRADATKMPFESGSFDAVTSFETLEHLENRSGFLSEIGRVLARDGVAVISTPNALYTLPINGRPRNPFHHYEYEPAELRAFLEKTFHQVELFGQTIDSRYVVPVFGWDQQFVEDPVVKANILVRRVLHRFPRRVRDGASRALWGHDFFPAANDYRFVDPSVKGVSNLIAVCRSPRR